MKRTRVKICGITRAEDARAAVAAGADAVGLVFWEQSKRAVTIEQAKAICAQIPPFVSIVALIVESSRDEVVEILSSLPIDIVQFHGDQTPEECGQYQRPFYKAIRVHAQLDLEAEIEQYLANDYQGSHNARGILLDTYRKGVPGGTGESFDWELIPKQYRSRIILAGGLNADNVAEAIKQVNPYAVDVSGGVEASPGVKDKRALDLFFKAIESEKNI